MTPLLSILICSIPSRFDKAKQLYNDIAAMCEGLDIEIIILTDNKTRSIGAKREALKNISRGKYFFFVDDDDSLYSVKEIYEACKSDVDVISFKVRCTNSNGSEYIVTAGLGNDIEHNSVDGNYVDMKRPPSIQAVWHSKFKNIPFPDITYNEDWIWLEKVLKEAKTEIHIPLVLQGYNFDPNTSEAYPATIAPKRCVVNLATGQFRQGQKRLHSYMLFHNQWIPLILWGSEAELFAPLHADNPYAFKIDAIQAAREMGYEQILWVDASVYPVKDITPVFDYLTEKGIFLEEAGHYAGQWANEAQLKYFGLTKDEAMKMPMFSAGFCGFDFRNPISQEFFAEWKEAMLNGVFKGRWEDSRHDMTAGSIIANKQGLLPLYSKGGTFFAYIGEGFGTPKETVVCHLQGM